MWWRLRLKRNVGLAACIGFTVMVVEGLMMTLIYKNDMGNYLSAVQISVMDAGIVGLVIMICTSLMLRYQADKSEFTLAKYGLSHAALASLGKGAVVTDSSGKILFINNAFESITGYSWHDVKGKTPAILQSGKQSTEFYSKMWHDLSERGKWRGTLWNKRKDGELYHERLNIRKFVGPSGDIGFVGVFVYISEQDELERALINAQKRELMATLVGGVAHNFNNYLTSIQANAFFGESKSTSDKVRYYFSEIMSVSERAAELVKELLRISHPDAHERKEFDFREAICNTISISKSLLPSNIEFVVDIPNESIGNILGNRSDLEQTVLNLVANSRDALEGQSGARILFKMEQSCKGGQSCKVACPHNDSCPVNSLSTALITIEDNGPGIPKDIQDRIFNPFFTTKEVGKGTGLGLSSASQIIISHGGAIWLKSGSKIGSRFFICIPLLDKDVLPESQSSTGG